MATVKRHRAWLVEAGFLIPQGGGHQGATARYLIATPGERAARAAAGPPPAGRVSPIRPTAPKL